ncbi:unnamed protein product [Pleuronectes platessa]|uniref:Uncharacterized protein n=1 Tax=Pleuronectes platessa TaxID=8262 RepID=A0A9N7UAE7_PLEPL|nr:unnamed protein product [Pleuronectes platessa]
MKKQQTRDSIRRAPVIDLAVLISGEGRRRGRGEEEEEEDEDKKGGGRQEEVELRGRRWRGYKEEPAQQLQNNPIILCSRRSTEDREVKASLQRTFGSICFLPTGSVSSTHNQITQLNNGPSVQGSPLPEVNDHDVVEGDSRALHPAPSARPIGGTPAPRPMAALVETPARGQMSNGLTIALSLDPIAAVPGPLAAPALDPRPSIKPRTNTSLKGARGSAALTSDFVFTRREDEFPAASADPESRDSSGLQLLPVPSGQGSSVLLRSQRLGFHLIYETESLEKIIRTPRPRQEIKERQTSSSVEQPDLDPEPSGFRGHTVHV